MIREFVGRVSVDSGQVMIVDPCYLGDWKHGNMGDASDERMAKVAKGEIPPDNDYDHACCVTCTGKAAGQMNLAVASRTAYGDGTYPVFAVYETTSWSDKRQLKGLFIDFNHDPEEEGDWEITGEGDHGDDEEEDVE